MKEITDLIMKNTKQPNPCRQNGLFRAALMLMLTTATIATAEP